MATQRFEITVAGLPQREQDEVLAELTRAIRQAAPDASVEREQTNPTAQDFGATLVLVLGSSAAIAVARGIGAAIGRYQGAQITVSNGNVSATGLTSKDAMRLAEFFAGAAPETR